MPTITFTTDDLKRFGQKWDQNGGALSRSRPGSSLEFGELFDARVGWALAQMLGGIPIIKPNANHGCNSRAVPCGATELGPTWAADELRDRAGGRLNGGQSGILARSRDAGAGSPSTSSMGPPSGLCILSPGACSWSILSRRDCHHGWTSSTRSVRPWPPAPLGGLPGRAPRRPGSGPAPPAVVRVRGETPGTAGAGGGVRGQLGPDRGTGTREGARAASGAGPLAPGPRLHQRGL
jgi:hypothetical protein